MTIVKVDRQADGSASIAIPARSVGYEALSLLIRDQETNLYLDSAGWKKAPTRAPVTRSQQEGLLILELTSTVAAHLRAGALIMVEDLDATFTASVLWPPAPLPPEQVPLPAPVADTRPSVSGLSPETTSEQGDASVPASSPEGRFRTSKKAWAATVLLLLLAAGGISAYGMIGNSPQKPQQVISNTRPPSLTVPPEAANDQGRKIQLQQELIQNLQAEIDGLQRKMASVSPSPAEIRGNPAKTAELDEAQRMIGDLRQENLQLQNRLQGQSDTISSWAVDRTAAASRIRELEKELALRIANAPLPSTMPDGTPTLPVPTESWMAAAVNTAGSVEVVTGFDSDDAARTAVLVKCKRTRSSCELIGTYRDMCFSVARPNNQKIMEANYWYQHAGNRSSARQAALRECDEGSGGYCATAFTVCSSDN